MRIRFIETFFKVSMTSVLSEDSNRQVQVKRESLMIDGEYIFIKYLHLPLIINTHISLSSSVFIDYIKHLLFLSQ